MNKQTTRYEIIINGIVQGVGFRPHIYRLASFYNLHGYVINTTKGVLIDIEGKSDSADSFLKQLQEGNIPPLSKIISLTYSRKEPYGYSSFKILESVKEEGDITLVSPDISICSDCLRELCNPSDRRYQYPFINCTNCGPRYSIIQQLPYDRKNTTMHDFVMCPDCSSEYTDPLDRRFHAQPDACFKCGPHVKLLDSSGKVLETKHAISAVKELLEAGAIVAIKGLGGFHLAVDASNNNAIERLREKKRREEKPLAVMVKDIEIAEQLCKLNETNRHFLLMPQRPIVLIEKKDDMPLSPAVAPHNKYLGIFLPYTPLHYLIMEGNYPALVMTSANISEEPICKDNDETLRRLDGIAEYYLMHNRKIYQRCDDSVISIVKELPLVIRRSRGYAPEPVMLPFRVPDVIATGAHLKNTVCLGKEDKAFVSQHIGDLETFENYKFFLETIRHLTDVFAASPEIIVHDMHPGYLSSQWAVEQSLPCMSVQHHEAHVAACMAEHHLFENVIGVSFDGTGYGRDSTIWGSEFFIGKPGLFLRAAHLDYAPMPGGEVAAYEPYRMAVAYLYKYFGSDWLQYPLELIEYIGSKKIRNIFSLIENRINCPQTCGCGRLFDAVSSLLGIRYFNKYEGQAPMELEMLLRHKDIECRDGPMSPRSKAQIVGADPCVRHQRHKALEDNDNSHYAFEIVDGACLVVSLKSLFADIINDIVQKKDKSIIALLFHNTIVEIIKNICFCLRTRYGINNAVLSGGCFQNKYLLSKTVDELESAGFMVYCHQQVPPNDGCISLGQVYTLACKLAGDGRDNPNSLSL